MRWFQKSLVSDYFFQKNMSFRYNFAESLAWRNLTEAFVLLRSGENADRNLQLNLDIISEKIDSDLSEVSEIIWNNLMTSSLDDSYLSSLGIYLVE